METNFQLEVIINVLVTSFRFTYGHYTYCDSFSAEIDFNVRIWRQQTSHSDVKVNLRASRVKVKQANAVYSLLTFRGDFELLVGSVSR